MHTAVSDFMTGGGTSDALRFHHIGVSCRSIKRDLDSYSILGYSAKEEKTFEDAKQGVRGVFITAEGAPTLELLENLEGSTTLDAWLERGQKLYHIGYCVYDIQRMIDILLQMRGRILSPLKQSVYFRKRICFMMLPNRQLIELIEL